MLITDAARRLVGRSGHHPTQASERLTYFPKLSMLVLTYFDTKELI